MTRVVSILVVVLAAGSVGCKSSDKAADQPAAGSGATVAAGAGTVQEVAGAVKIAGKPAAVGDKVQADDVVETGADGRVVIELTHNLARWELGPNKAEKVNQSIAWKLPRNEGNAKVVIQDMSAAGRQGERSAADTTASAPAAAPAAAAPAAETATPRSPAPPPPPPSASQAKKDLEVLEQEAAKRPTPGISPPKTKTDESQRGLGQSGGLAGIGGGTAGGTGANAGAGGGVTVSHAAAVPGGGDAHALLEKQSTAMSKCLAAAGDQLAIVVHVGADGKAKVEYDAGVDAKVRACVDAIVKRLAFPATKADVKLTVVK